MFIYAGVAVGRIPRLRMSRATIALVGALLLVLVGALTEEEAYHAIDIGTILLLGAMMVVNVNLRMAGFFRFVATRTLRIAKTPQMLLALVIGSAGVLSAVFLNDPVCIMFTPVVADLTRRLQRDPLPYLVGLAVAANVGSVATLTGNPQNLIIGQASGIPYLTFMAYLAPVALVGLGVCWAVIVLAYPQEFKTPLVPAELPPPRPFTPLLNRTLWVVGALMVAFVAGAPIVTAACAAAGALLISRLKPQRLLAIDWDLLAFFAGLFVVTGALEASGLSGALFAWASPFLSQGIGALTLVTAVLSNAISNVPAVLLLQTQVNTYTDPQAAWLTLAMASTLAGNFTLLGSAATLIVAEVARQQHIEMGFVAYLRAGIPITLITLAIGWAWLAWIL